LTLGCRLRRFGEPVERAATILVAAAILASLMPAARAARIDVVQALRSE